MASSLFAINTACSPYHQNAEELEAIEESMPLEAGP